MPALLREFASYSEERFAIDIVSQISAAKREKRTADAALSGEQVRVRQLEFDYTAPAYLESLDPPGYDNVVLLPSERLKSGTESDARTIMGCLLLRGLSEGGSGGPSSSRRPGLELVLEPEHDQAADGVVVGSLAGGTPHVRAEGLEPARGDRPDRIPAG